jgi:hypothetical protein
MRQENHASPKRGISKMKSQGSAASNRKTLQSQIRQSAQNRLSINALDIVHGQLINMTVTAVTSGSVLLCLFAAKRFV